MKSFRPISQIALALVLLLHLASCNQGESEDYYEAFFYTTDILFETDAGRYKIQGEYLSDNRPFSVGYLEDDCETYDGYGCAACKNKEGNPSANFESGDYLIEVLDTETNQIVSSKTITVSTSDYGKCKGIEVQL